MNRRTKGSESAAAGQVARVEELCRSYLTGMESSDVEALLSIFTGDATATSPISGNQPVRDFYSAVMRITSARSMTLGTLFTRAPDPSTSIISCDGYLDNYRK